MNKDVRGFIKTVPSAISILLVFSIEFICFNNMSYISHSSTTLKDNKSNQ